MWKSIYLHGRSKQVRLDVECVRIVIIGCILPWRSKTNLPLDGVDNTMHTQLWIHRSSQECWRLQIQCNYVTFLGTHYLITQPNHPGYIYYLNAGHPKQTTENLKRSWKRFAISVAISVQHNWGWCHPVQSWYMCHFMYNDHQQKKMNLLTCLIDTLAGRLYCYIVILLYWIWYILLRKFNLKMFSN